MAAQAPVFALLDDLTSDHVASFFQQPALEHKHVNASYTFLTCAANVPHPLLQALPANSFLQPLLHARKIVDVGANAILRPTHGRTWKHEVHSDSFHTKKTFTALPQLHCVNTATSYLWFADSSM
jgi:hypothetical protein